MKPGHLSIFALPLAAIALALAPAGCRQTPKNVPQPAVCMLRPHEALPEEFADDVSCTKIFLAGTIDMGSGEDWQAGLSETFAAMPGQFVLYNPRQENWDASRPGEMDYQVGWELEHLEMADLIIMNILPGSKSPITLLELGLFARSGKLLVACPPDFYRYDNVRITCIRYGVPLYGSLGEMMDEVAIRCGF